MKNGLDTTVKGLDPGVISKVGCQFDRPDERSPV